MEGKHMYDKNEDVISQKQKTVKPRIEDVIGDLIEGENLQIALEFIDYLRRNKMSIQWASTNSWKVNYKSTVVCYIKAGTGLHPIHKLKEGSWLIYPHGDFTSRYGNEKITTNEDLLNTAWANVRYCKKCRACAPGVTMEIMGRKFDNLCKNPGIDMRNPNAAAIECVKVLLQIRCDAIDYSKVPKVN